MAKSANYSVTVTKAFVHEGTIRVPGSNLSLSEASAKPLLEAGKVVLDNDGEKAAAGKTAKPAAETKNKPAAETKKD